MAVNDLSKVFGIPSPTGTLDLTPQFQTSPATGTLGLEQPSTLQRAGSRISNNLARMGGYDPMQLSNAEQRKQARLAGLQELSYRLSQASAKLSGDPARMQIAQQQEAQRIEARQPKELSLTAGRKDAEYFKTLTPEQQRQFLIATGRMSPELAVEFREAKAQGGKDLTPGQIQVDKKFADTLVAWNTGEKQQADNNITNLDNKIERLISGKENVSGREFAFIPDMLKPVFRPVATGFLDEISDVTYQSLRATLGAQFTENEGKKLIAATFNQNLPEEQNIIRLQRLSAKIKAIRDSKERSIDYFNKNGTLQGYTEEPQSFDDILDSILFEEFQTLSVEEITDSYAKASTAPERQSILRFIKILKEQAKEQGQE